VQAALEIAWGAANFISARRLVPFLPKLVPVLEQHGHLRLTDAVRMQLLTISPALDTTSSPSRTKRQRSYPNGVIFREAW
jgi:hypothetical protein